MMEILVNEISSIQNFGITCHTSPDGDALGSVLALTQGLRKLGKDAYILSKDKLPDNFSFLPFSNELNEAQSVPKKDTDCVIVLDCGNIDRISADLEDYNGKIINIDHHLSNDRYGDINYIDTNAAGTVEIIYDLLNQLNVKLDSDISKCLYCGLVTDTGSFRHSNTTSKTHNIASNLLSKNIEHSSIHSSIFDNKSIEKLKLTGAVLSSMSSMLEGKLIVIEITEELAQNYNCSIDDTSDIISFGMQIKNVEATVLFRETSVGTKVSLRSRNTLDVRNIAEAFGGGGHIRASGITLKNISLKDAKKMILQKIEEEMILWME